MRAWLTTRCVLIAVLLIVAPGAALAHLLLTWLPGKIAVTQLARQVVQDRQRIDGLAQENQLFRERLTQLAGRAGQAQHAQTSWLPQRDRDRVFDLLAGAFRAENVSLERLVLYDPDVCIALSRAELLACERVELSCTGGYTALTACLDRLATLALPLRVTNLAWSRAGDTTTLTLGLDIPFLPDDTLRAALLAASGLELEEEDEL